MPVNIAQLVDVLVGIIPASLRIYQSAKTTKTRMEESGVFSPDALIDATVTVADASSTLLDLHRAAGLLQADGYQVAGFEELEALADEIMALPDRTQDWT